MEEVEKSCMCTLLSFQDLKKIKLYGKVKELQPKNGQKLTSNCTKSIYPPTPRQRKSKIVGP